LADISKSGAVMTLSRLAIALLVCGSWGAAHAASSSALATISNPQFVVTDLDLSDDVTPVFSMGVWGIAGAVTVWDDVNKQYQSDTGPNPFIYGNRSASVGQVAGAAGREGSVLYAKGDLRSLSSGTFSAETLASDGQWWAQPTDSMAIRLDPHASLRMSFDVQAFAVLDAPGCVVGVNGIDNLACSLMDASAKAEVRLDYAYEFGGQTLSDAAMSVVEARASVLPVLNGEGLVGWTHVPYQLDQRRVSVEFRNISDVAQTAVLRLGVQASSQIVSSVPEPGTGFQLLMGLAGLGWMAARRSPRG
jgi:PEP-CTERM motif